MDIGRLIQRDSADLSGEIVMRAVQIPNSALELIGLVLARRQLQQLLDRDESKTCWFFIDEVARWLDLESERSDILAVSFVSEAGRRFIRMVVLEAKYIASSAFASAAQKSRRQLTNTYDSLRTKFVDIDKVMSPEIWRHRLADMLVEHFTPFEHVVRLAETGYVEDRNVAIEYRWADDHYNRLPALAQELVQRQVAVLAAPGSPAALPAKAATTVIPTVFMMGSDPVPGGNLTGYAYLNVEIAPKRLELLHEFLPTARSIALLVNPANPNEAAAQTGELQGAAEALGVRLMVANASSAIELEDAFATLVRNRVKALQLGVDPLFGNHIDQIVALATRSKISTIYPWREFTAAGGLMNYGASIPDAFHQVGIYTGQISKGAKPADLPVQRPTKLHLVLNVTTAKALGIEFPAKLLASADEVIE
jgi:ABC-type uncharacterized transport system substrate-binding protein